ncbi:MAG: type I methionyl aminopeptidase [Microbacteriaceae bacterium]|nr:type I methionyl aminopeptidase [Microbacteriaceae bacterium]
MPRDASGTLIAGTISPRLLVPESIPRPEYAWKSAPAKYTGTDVKTPEQIEKIRHSGKIAAQAIAQAGSMAQPGVTTDSLDKVVHEFLLDHKAYPSTLGYRNYPKSCCTSVNEVICHGIPDDTVLEDGDIINIDVTAYVDGFHGDSNQTFEVGDVSPEIHDLVERTREALNRGLMAVAPGREVNVIGRAIESYAKRFNYGVVRDFTGHGIGEAFHSGLIIPHYDTNQYTQVMEVGMVFTIEPMLTLGTYNWDMWKDQWTVTTRDKSVTAQFEHTLVVTDTGYEILTLP